MITSKQILQMSEEYLTSKRIGNNLVEVYVNPTSSDYQHLYSINSSHGLRFTADIDTKKFYVWDGFTMMHGEAADLIGIYSKYQAFYKRDSIRGFVFGNNLFMGYGTVNNNKLTLIHLSDILETSLSVLPQPASEHFFDGTREYFKDILSSRWNWISKYIDCSNYFNKIKGKLVDTV